MAFEPITLDSPGEGEWKPSARFEPISIEPIKSGDIDDVKRGFKRSLVQAPEFFYGAGALAAMSAEKLFGEGGLSTAAKDYFAEKYVAKQAENQKYAPSVEFTDARENLKAGDVGSMVDWLQDTAGYVVGQGLQTLLTGGIGAAAGKLALAGATEKMLGSYVANQAAKIAEASAGKMAMAEATKLAAQRTAQAIGAGLVLSAQNTGMEAGDIYGGLMEQAEKTGEPITGDDLLRAWTMAAAAAGTETATDLLGLGAVTGRLKIGGKAMQEMTGAGGRAVRGATAAAIGMPVEAGQEYAQTYLEQVGAGQPTDTTEAQRERVNAAAVGGVGGTVMGGGIGLISGARPATPSPSGEPTPTTDDLVRNIANSDVGIDEFIADTARATGTLQTGGLIDSEASKAIAGGLDVLPNQIELAREAGLIEEQRRIEAEAEARLIEERAQQERDRLAALNAYRAGEKQAAQAAQDEADRALRADEDRIAAEKASFGDRLVEDSRQTVAVDDAKAAYGTDTPSGFQIEMAKWLRQNDPKKLQAMLQSRLSSQPPEGEKQAISGETVDKKQDISGDISAINPAVLAVNPPIIPDETPVQSAESFTELEQPANVNAQPAPGEALPAPATTIPAQPVAPQEPPVAQPPAIDTELLGRVDDALAKMRARGATEDNEHYARLKAKRDAIAAGEKYATKDVAADLIAGIGGQIGTLTKATGLRPQTPAISGVIPDTAQKSGPDSSGATITSREPWEMTRQEWAGGNKTTGQHFTPQSPAYKQAAKAHRTFVEQAIAAGKPVPAAVLADYPDLQQNLGTSPQVSAVLPKTGIPSEVSGGRSDVAKGIERPVGKILGADVRKIADANLARFAKSKNKKVSDLAIREEAWRAAQSVTPERTVITPSEDVVIGKNAAGEQLYERPDGSVYRMQTGRPDFGGDLAVAEAAETKPAESPKPAAPVAEAAKPTTDLNAALQRGIKDAEEHGKVNIEKPEYPAILNAYHQVFRALLGRDNNIPSGGVSQHFGHIAQFQGPLTVENLRKNFDRYIESNIASIEKRDAKVSDRYYGSGVPYERMADEYEKAAKALRRENKETIDGAEALNPESPATKQYVAAVEAKASEWETKAIELRLQHKQATEQAEADAKAAEEAKYKPFENVGLPIQKKELGLTKSSASWLMARYKDQDWYSNGHMAITVKPLKNMDAAWGQRHQAERKDRPDLEKITSRIKGKAVTATPIAEYDDGKIRKVLFDADGTLTGINRIYYDLIHNLYAQARFVVRKGYDGNGPIEVALPSNTLVGIVMPLRVGKDEAQTVDAVKDTLARNATTSATTESTPTPAEQPTPVPPVSEPAEKPLSAADHLEAAAKLMREQEKPAQPNLEARPEPAPRQDSGGPDVESYARGEPGPGLPAADIRAHIAGITDNLSVAVPVYDSVEQARLAGFKIADDAQGFAKGDRLGLISGRINTLLQAEKTLFHELWHVGIKRVTSDQDTVKAFANYNAALNKVAMANPDVRKRAAEWRAQYGKDKRQQFEDHKREQLTEAKVTGKAQDDIIKAAGPELELRVRLQSFDEAIAEIAGERRGKPITRLNELIAALQRLVRALGFDRLADWAESVTDAEVLSLIRSATQAVGKDTATFAGVMAGEPSFSRLDQTQTAEFRKWFGDSKVVDAEGKPLVVYHGTGADFSEFSGGRNGAMFFTSDPEEAAFFAEIQSDKRDAENVIPAYLSIKTPEMADYEGELNFERLSLDIEQAKEDGKDGLIIKNVGDGTVPPVKTTTYYIAFRPEQIKSASGNRGTFDPGDPDIMHSRAGLSWDAPEPSKIDNLLYSLQDKQIDTKRVLEQIRKHVAVSDTKDVRLQEELYHGRTAKLVDDFLNTEMKPLVAEMVARKVTMPEFEEYLHARHAEEANTVIAARNPNLPDGGSGMDTQDARDYLSSLDPAKKRAYEALALRVDAINGGSRQMLVDYGLESQDTIDTWKAAYKNYVPLHREDMGGGPGIGQGFSVRGPASKMRTGSTRKVVNIIANIAMQREKNIVRGEKNRVALALYGLAKDNPNPDFWSLAKPGVTTQISAETGDPVDVIDMSYQGRDNVVMSRMPDKSGKIVQHGVEFNHQDERAMRMALALKNLDKDDLGHVLGMSAKITRYFSAVNTQYNPVFGVVNFVRDVQGAMFNLSSTELAGRQAEVLKNTLVALRGIYIDARDTRQGKPATSSWAQLWEEFQVVGGKTGYRDMFRTGNDRAEAIEREIAKVSEGKAKQFGRAVFDWLSDYNTAGENAVRLAAYKVGIDQGMTKQRAASLAKNLTVNFNRKGQIATQAGALYAFFNATVQGTARIAETLSGPMGRKIIIGGITLGSIQALMLAAAGFDDDEPPEFIRERSTIIPIGDKKYITIPMPLGLHFIPNIGRIATEFALSGFKNPAKRVMGLANVFADAFNPVGSAGLSLQTITPTVIDPIAALAENRDWTGKPITRQDMSQLSPTPGHTRAKDTASAFSKATSKALNYLSGGTDYKPGLFSPSPDSIDYLIGQATGGVGRETMKLEQSIASAFTGEDLPTYKIPLVGRFYGDSEQQSSQGNAFYSNLKEINEHEAEVKGRRKAGEPIGDYFSENPEARLIQYANATERQVSKLRKRKRELMAKDADPGTVKAIDLQITARMKQFNDRVKQVSASAP